MEKKLYEDIELRSEEVQEVMNRVPSSILRYGIGGMLLIVLLLLGGSALLRYPETVSADFVLTFSVPPVYIQAKTDGRLERLYVRNRQTVSKGDILAVFENVAVTDDILELRSRLDAWKVAGARTERLGDVFFHRLPRLGYVQTSYSSCLTAWNRYLQHMQESRLYETELNNAVAQLITSISQWETEYLAVSPIDGQVVFMQLWKENRYVTAGETVFVVVPPTESIPEGKATLSMHDIGKVRTGQRAFIRLAGFPEQEYGTVEGVVASISPVPDKDGNYIVVITFPNNLHTRYGKEFPMLKVMNGTADIIIRERNLLRRLMNL